MTYNEYINGKINDLQIIASYLPEMSAEINIAIEECKQAFKVEPLATEIRNKISFLLGHEISWAEADIYNNLFMIKAASMCSEKLAEINYEEITSSDYIKIITDEVLTQFVLLLGIESNIDNLKESISTIMRQMLALE